LAHKTEQTTSTMVKLATKLSILTAALAAPTTTALNFGTIESSCVNGPTFVDQNVTITCDGESSCTFGDTAEVTGTVTATADFEDMNVTLQPCLTGICSTSYAASADSVCDWVTPDGEFECGEAGDYIVNYSVKIPDTTDVPNYYTWFSSMITVKIIVGTGEECQVEAEPESAEPESADVSYAMFGVVALVVGAASYEARRRSRSGRDDKAAPLVEMRSASLV